MTTYLEVEDLLEISSIILGSPPKVRDYGLLTSAAARPSAFAFGQEAYPDLATKAASLFQSLCCNHALIDGNKRLAWAATMVFVGLNDDRPVPAVDVDRAEAFVLAVVDGLLVQVNDIAAGLRHLGVVD